MSKKKTLGEKRYITDKRFPGVRKRSLGFVEGFGEDWVFSMNCRDKNQQGKVRYDKIGKASEGWTMQKAYLEKERILAEGQVLEIKSFDEVTLKDVFLDYSQFYAREKPHVIREYKAYSRHIPFFDSVPIINIKNRMVQDLRKKLEQFVTPKGTPYAPKTIGNILKVIRLIINHGVKRELCAPRHDLVIDVPKVDNKVTEFLTEEQLSAYLKALDEDKDTIGVIFLKVALYTGMRPKAIMHLKWSDLDYENNRIMLRGETAKNGTTDYIPLPEKLKGILADVPRTKYSVYVFEQRNGLPRTTFNKTANRIKERAGLPSWFRPIYMLRHNFATQLASSGKVELYAIQKLLTHKSPQMTLRYAHLMDKTVQDASKVMEEILEGSVSGKDKSVSEKEDRSD